ncbi:MAG: hypothetical protein Q8909_12775 [Bacteroidota bacterium]|nr:hypothetical protein [Bacteroidota bacterium]
MKNRKLAICGIFILMIIIGLCSCAQKEVVDACLKGHTYGFWGGLWHGFIAPFDLIGMIFRDNVTMYAQNNNGAWYAFGFLIGSGGWGFMGRHGMKK